MSDPTPETYEVFVSYRRDSAAAEARLIRTDLIQRGIRVFMDVTDLGKGLFDQALLDRIAETPNFIVILSPHSLDRTIEKGNWVCTEVAQAIRSNCNIIPVFLEEFKFPRQPPPEIADLQRYQGVNYSHEFFEAMMARIMTLLREVKPQADRTPGRRAGDRASWVRHLRWVIPAIVLVAVATTWGVYYQQKRAADAKLVSLARKLRTDFHTATDAAPEKRTLLLNTAQADVDAIFALDGQNGHAFYYQDEIKRAQHPELFTGGCVIPSAFQKNPQVLDGWEDRFMNYLSIEGSLPASEVRKGNYGQCYNSAAGYCPERTAWIDHLLAFDRYQEALVTNDRNTGGQLLAEALGEEKESASLFQDQQHTAGFTQCMPSASLIAAIQERQTALQP